MSHYVAVKAQKFIVEWNIREGKIRIWQPAGCVRIKSSSAFTAWFWNLKWHSLLTSDSSAKRSLSSLMWGLIAIYHKQHSHVCALGFLPTQPECCALKKGSTDNEKRQFNGEWTFCFTALCVCSVVSAPHWEGNIMEHLKSAHSNFDISSGLWR